jgi:hypothetical protein
MLLVVLPDSVLVRQRQIDAEKKLILPLISLLLLSLFIDLKSKGPGIKAESDWYIWCECDLLICYHTYY